MTYPKHRVPAKRDSRFAQRQIQRPASVAGLCVGSKRINPHRNLVILGLAILLSGCSPRAVVTSSVERVLQQIASVDVNMDHYPSYAEYHPSVWGQVKAAVHGLSSPSELKSLFAECHRRWKTAPDPGQERLQWINPDAEACDAILARLADLDSEEATRTLVQLYADDAFGWDAAFAVDAAHAISRCGRKAVPFLSAADFGGRRARVQEIVRCIQKGELYGP